MTDPLTLDKYIDSFLKVRAARDKFKKDMKTKLAEYEEALDTIAGALKVHLQSNGLQNIATDTGTAFLRRTSRATVADMAAFREHVIANKDYDVADFRASTDGVENYMENNGGNLPAGINFQTYVEVSVQKR